MLARRCRDRRRGRGPRLASNGRRTSDADPDYLIGIPGAVAAAAAVRLPGIRLVAGELHKPIRRMLRVEHSIDELAAPGNRGSVDLDAQRADADVAQSSEAAVLFTSGATGPPKGVVYRHHQMRAQLDVLRTLCDVDPSDSTGGCLRPVRAVRPGSRHRGRGAHRWMSLSRYPHRGTAGRGGIGHRRTLVFASPAALRNGSPPRAG